MMIDFKLIDDSEEIKLEMTDYNDTEIRHEIDELQNSKVDKIEGKGLSTNDYTTVEKNKLAGLNNYNDTEVRQLISEKQDQLVSGTNIKTINGDSILGSGNLIIESHSGTTDYNDLENKPSINNITLSGNKTGTQLGLASSNDIPKKTSDLTNDSGFITSYTETDPTVPSYVKNITQSNITTWNNKSDFSGSYNDLTDKPTIPDVSNFITKDANDLTYYYTKTEVDGKVSSVYKYKGTVSTYGDLPSSNLTVGDVYNVETADSIHGIKAGDNVAWDGTAWDVLSGTVDLSGYQEKIDSSHKLGADLVDDSSSTNKFVTASDKTSWNGKYTKPSGGIPKTDLASAVQTSLGKADTALQSETYTGTITSVKMNGTIIASSGEANLGTVITSHQDISGKQDKLIAGTNITIANDGKTISATDTTYSNATTSTSGLMSSTDKTKLNGIASGAEVNVQSNWNETDDSSDAYIQNKPTIPTVPTNVSAFNNDAGYLTSHQDISGKEDSSNKSNSYTVSSTTTYASTKALVDGLGTKQNTISDLSTIRSGASLGATALQSITSSDVTTALGYTPYNSTNPNGYTSNTGTITGITMNGSSKGTSGVVNLGTVITDVSGKLDVSKVKNTMSTTAGDVYDVRYINTMIGDIETLLSEV